MNQMIDIVSRMQEQRDSFRPAERRVADVVLKDVEFAVRASNADLAQRAQVSEPTVTRFCRTLGCDGVRDFKLKLAQSLAVATVYLRQPPSMTNGVSADIWSSVFQHAHGAMSQAERQLDRRELQRAVRKIAEAKRIFVFGVGGGSTTVAQDAQYRLFRLGLAVTAYADGHLLRMGASTLGADDVLIAISATGRAPEVNESVSIARQYGATVIGITRSNTALADRVDIRLLVDIDETSDVLTPTASRYAFLATVDLLAAYVAYHMGPQAQEQLRRVRHNLMNFRAGEVFEPLGD